MNQFNIEFSFAIQPDRFVFAGTVVQGEARQGMSFEVSEAGHNRRVTIRTVESILKAGGRELPGLVVDNGQPGFLPGLGTGQTVELREVTKP